MINRNQVDNEHLQNTNNNDVKTDDTNNNAGDKTPTTRQKKLAYGNYFTLDLNKEDNKYYTHCTIKGCKEALVYHSGTVVIKTTFFSQTINF